MPTVRALVFDVDKVLSDMHLLKVYDAFAARVHIPRSVVHGYHKQHLGALLIGETSFEKFVEQMQQHTTVPDIQKIWFEVMSDIVRVNDDLLRFVETLHANGYRLGILSNTVESKIAIDKKLGLYEPFDVVCLSCREGVKKPDASFYQTCLKRLDVVPEESVFIDDQELHVAAAREIGMHGILFLDNNSLRLELEKLGVR